MQNEPARDMIISHITLRRVIGILVIVLPFVCILGGLAFGGSGIERSVSHYYHTNMRDLLIGLLGCVSIFLFSYKGYTIADNLITGAIGLACAGVAAFPCPPAVPTGQPLGIFQLPPGPGGLIHLICAGAFFILLAINSIFLFTISKDTQMTPQKKLRNGFYIGLGIVILASMATLIILYLAAPDVIVTTNIALVLETIMLCSFGVSWLIKGETLFKDKKQSA
jgi:hypothetical protein